MIEPSLAPEVASLGAAAPPASRLLHAALGDAGARVSAAPARVLDATRDVESSVERLGPGERALVIGWIGTHPDAEPPLLSRAWRLEEAARATGASVLVLRLAPLIGPRAPLVACLSGRARLGGRLARTLVQPVLEADAAAALSRAVSGEAPWSGCHEVCGAEIFTLDELRERARARADATAGTRAAWEPAPEVLRAQGLAEWEPWARAFGVSPGSVTAWLERGPGA